MGILFGKNHTDKFRQEIVRGRLKSIICFVAITQTSLQRTLSTPPFGLSLNASYLTLFKRPFSFAGIVFVLLFIFLPKVCLAKNIYPEKTIENPFAIDRKTEVLAKLTMDCNIQANLGEHIQHIIAHVLPRVSREIQQLLKPQKDIHGNFLQMAESIDAGGLFHTHIRTPLTVIAQPAERGLHPLFSDSQAYHLQYHSFERFDLFKSRWLQELESTQDPELQNWISEREKILTEYNRKESAFSYGQNSTLFEIIKRWPVITDEVRQKYVTLWYQSLYGNTQMDPELDQWVRQRLDQKLRMLEPFERFYEQKITVHRSIVSTDERFIIIRPLNIDGFSQQATVYFEERSDNSEVENVIRRAESLGYGYILNHFDGNFPKESFPKNIHWDQHAQLAKNLRSAALQSDDPLYNYKRALADDYSFEKHYFFSWDEQFIYSVNYFIRCNISDIPDDLEDRLFRRPSF